MFLGDDAAAEAAAQYHLGRMATVLAGSERHVSSMREAKRDEATPGSLIASQLALEPSMLRPELKRPVFDAFGFASIGILAAGDHLALLAKAIAPPPHPFATATLARQAVEVSARSWYLFDPDVTPLRRAARLVTELLYSHWEGDLQGFPPADGRPRSEHVAQLIGWANHFDLEVKKGRQGLWVAPDERPRAHEIVRSMMGPIGSQGYGIFSAISHATPGGLVDRLHSEDSNDNEAQIALPLSDIAILVTWTLHGFLIASCRYFEVHGWNDGMTTEWRLHALEVAKDARTAFGLGTEG